MKINSDVKLDFSDVLFEPKRSELSSRSEVKLERTFNFRHSKRTWTGVPVVVSNMDTTGTVEMARALTKRKMITCLHKFHTPDDIPEDLDREHFAVTTGIRQQDLDNLKQMVAHVKPYFICIDVPNGYSLKFLDTVKQIRSEYPGITLIGGNVVTKELTEELIINCGLDIVKIGIGSGSVCTTRLQTGVGVPQFSAIMECSDAAHGIEGHIMSDGGVQHVGDISKAFGAGADFVMCGSMFCGHLESAGELIIVDGEEYKEFYGMSSTVAMEKYYGGVAHYRSEEGKRVIVPYKGKVENTLQNIEGGIRSTMTYIGARTLKNISKCATFNRVHNQVNGKYN